MILTSGAEFCLKFSCLFITAVNRSAIISVLLSLQRCHCTLLKIYNHCRLILWYNTATTNSALIITYTQAKSDTKIVFNSKFLEFLLVLSTCSRNGHIDDGSIKTIVDILKALIVAQYNTLEKQYQQQLANFNQQFVAKRDPERKSSSAPKKPAPDAHRHIDSSSSSKKGTVLVKDSDIQPTRRTISKEKLRSFLEKAWRYLESEDDQKLFLHQVYAFDWNLLLHTF